MLELKNTVKLYATKGGETVCALDHVSVRFGETGMVFLLGKSGSGKSTLLNVAGGLDFPTEGEIIVGARSSASFSAADFDSYRNTYVGFIFQEYNLLDEFSVRENVSLALELQGKARDRATIDRILEQVDLAGLGDRKPNTLSGGQKQRVAIARALVKDPQIIMADEPTGALDSETGKQVLDTLKKLSRDRLVLVVSHDRDFAEQYADRIVELADGGIISDVSRAAEEGANASEELCLKAGDVLTEEQLGQLKELVAAERADVIIEADDRSFRAVRRVRGRRGVFEGTGEIPVSRKETRLIQSRLPGGRAFQIGARSMKKKPFRLAFAILLSTVAFTVFGLMSSFMMYDPVQAGINAVKEQDYQALGLEKQFEYGRESPNYSNAYATEDEVKALSDRLGRTVYGVIGGGEYSDLNTDNSDVYWIKGILPMPEDDFRKNGFSVLCGTYPQNENEIAITAYQFELIRTYGWKELDEGGWPSRNEFGNEIAFTVERMEDVIGVRRKILGREHWVTVTAVVNCGEIPERVLSYRDDDDWEMRSYFNDWIDNSYHNCYFTVGDFVPRYVAANGPGEEIFSFYLSGASVRIGEWSYGTLVPFSAFSLYRFDIVWTEEEKTALAEDEIILYRQFFWDRCRTLDQLVAGKEDEMCRNLRESEEFLKFSEICKKSEEEVTTGELEFSLRFLNSHYEAVTGAKLCSVMSTGEDETVKSFRGVGLFWNPGKNGALLMTSDAAFDLFFTPPSDTNYVPSAIGCFSQLFLPLEGKEDAALNDVFAMIDVVGADGVRYTMESMVRDNAEFLSDVLSIMANVFLYGGIVFAVFAALLLFNFISATVSYKRREIGILRAVGARRADVFRIFFAESFVVMLICVLLSCVGGAVLTFVMNGVMIAGISASISFRAISFGIVNILIILAVSLVVAFLGTFLPVYRAAMKNPVDSIRSA